MLCRSVFAKSALIASFSILICIQVLHSQPDTSYVPLPPTPTAAAFGKFIEVPVAGHTGVPDISIPLHTVITGPLTLPLTLRYNASGIKVAEVASWVGIGWNLTAGGVISRSVNGLPDEGTNGFLAEAGNISLDGFFAEQVMLGNKDSEQDIFSFSIPGYAGKFLFDENGDVYTVPKMPLKIAYTNGGFPGLRFFISTPDGTRYIFGNYTTESYGAVEGRESSVNFVPTQIAPDDVVSSWMLVRIESYDTKHWIEFDYALENIEYHMPGYSNLFDYIPGGTTASNVNFTNYMASSRRLTTITTNIGEVIEFSANTVREDTGIPGMSSADVHALDSITISEGPFSTRWTFSYGYFEDPDEDYADNPVAKRLRLTQIRQKSTDGSVIIPPYVFDYVKKNGDYFLPQRLTKAKDYWGYYNARSSNENFLINIPTTQINSFTCNDCGGNRSSAVNVMQYGVLEKITYPTGGWTEFTFEENRYKPTAASPPLPIATQGTGFAIGYFDLETCSPEHDVACCGTNDDVEEDFYFGSSETEDIYLELFLDRTVQDNGTCGASINEASILLEVFLASNDSLMGSFNLGEFDIEDAPVTRTKIIKLIDLIPTLQADTLYDFKLTSFDAYGTATLYKPVYNISRVGTDSIGDQYIVGGLRAKEVRHYDPVQDNEVVTQYEYSDGILYQEYPIFAGQISGTLIYNGGGGFVQGNGITGAYFSDISTFPLEDLSGEHVGYEEVSIIQSDGGKTVREFLLFPNVSGYSGGHQENGVLIDDTSIFPGPVPPAIDIDNGWYKGEKQYQSAASTPYSETTLSKKTETKFEPTITSGLEFYRSKVLTALVSSPQVTGYLHFKYVTNYYSHWAGRPETKITMLDGVSINEQYEYDTSDNHPYPTSMATTNSDGSVWKTISSYPFDFTDAVNTERVSLNIISRPVQVQVLNDNDDQVDGTQQNYSFFNATSGQAAGSGIGPYLQEIERYEVTWNESENLSGSAQYNPIITIDKIDVNNGFPAQVSYRGWNAAHEYSYNPANNRLDTVTFEDFQWIYGYVSDTTRLLYKITDPDKQYKTFGYDALMRLKNDTSRLGNVITTYDYVYQESQSARNYLETTAAFTAVSGSQLTNLTDRHYLDGLGRSIQQIAVGRSPDNKDVIRAMTYDSVGRKLKEYEPYENNASSGAYVPISTLEGANVDFTLYGYEPAPTNRQTEVTPPNWYTTTTSYAANNSSVTVPGLSSFPASSLFEQTVTDPDGRKMITYIDKRGRMVLSRRTDTESAPDNDTYYVYDDKDRLQTVYPPGTSTSTDSLIYEYRYDDRDNILFKKIPDQDGINYLYDNRNLLSFTQDGKMLADNRWLHTKYDSYGRPEQVGFVNGTVTDGSSNPGFSESISRNFYDGDVGAADIYTGKVWKSEARILGSTNDWLTTIFTYDPHGRVSKTEANNHLNLADSLSEVITMNYDFVDNLIIQNRRHIGYSDTLRIDENWTFDHGGRSTGHFLDLNTTGAIQLCAQAYTVKDELKQKLLGGTGSDFLQYVDYHYLPNGFLDRINEFNLMNSGEPDDLFHLDLRYDEASTPLSVNAQKNGNISQAHWRVKGQDAKAYGYEYDYLNRLVSANYGIYQSSLQADTSYSTSYQYDQRGNITNLQRNGLMTDATSGFLSGAIDNLSYQYSGASNRLVSISDTGASEFKSYGFNDHGLAGVYGYDKNGNMEVDPYKQIVVGYNYLNLPENISQTGGGSIEWLYDANGTKLRKTTEADFLQLNELITSGSYEADSIYASGTVQTGSTVTLSADTLIRLLPGFAVKAGSEFTAGIAPTGNTVRDYVNGIEYRDGVLEAIYHSEGRIYFHNDTARYEYTITDHLGNTRVTFADLNADEQVDSTEILQENHYYPFGMEMFGDWTVHPEGQNQYLFNGIERNEDLGLNWDLANFRSYDAAIGRWMQTDPRAEKYYGMTPYNGLGNNPMLLADPLGDTLKITFRRGFLGLGKKQTVYYNNGNLTDAGGNAYTGKLKGFLGKAVSALNNINTTFSGNSTLSNLSASNFNFTVRRGRNRFEPDNLNRSNLALINPALAAAAGTGGTIRFSPSSSSSGPDQYGNSKRPSYIGLAHEIGHADRARIGMADLSAFNPHHHDAELQNVTNDEFNAAHFENQVRSEWGLPLRAAYTTDSRRNTFMHFLVPGTTRNASGYDYRVNNGFIFSRIMSIF